MNRTIIPVSDERLRAIARCISDKNVETRERAAYLGARAALEELGIVKVEELSLGELLMPFGGGDVQDGAILLRARK